MLWESFRMLTFSFQSGSHDGIFFLLLPGKSIGTTEGKILMSTGCLVRLSLPRVSICEVSANNPSIIISVFLLVLTLAAGFCS